MRIAIGGIMHESNSFSHTRTSLADFQQQSIYYGENLIDAWRHNHHEMGGFIEGAEMCSYELSPLLMASATPAGPVSADAFESLVGELLRRLRNAGNIDGLLLALHGAMVSEEHLDADGEIVERVRQTAGPDLPVVVTHDFHANVSERIVRHSTALIVYKTNPHVDQRQRGLQAAHLMARIARGEVKPTQALAKPPMLLNIRFHNTSQPPLVGIMDALRQIEENDDRVLAASFAGAYQYSDVPEMGPAAVVVTDDDSALAQGVAHRISARLWEQRDALIMHLPDACEGVKMAVAEHSPPPVILVDMGDNIGGGASGDGTALLQELLRQRASGWLIVLCDPEAVNLCAEAGIDSEVTLMVGGKYDDLHGAPAQIRGRVRALHNGKFEEREARHGGVRFNDQGKTAVLAINAESSTEENYLVLTSRRQPPFSLQQILSLGIDPAPRKIIVVKAAVAFRAAYEPIAGRIIEVDTPGLTSVNPSRLRYRRVRKPMWGLNGVADP
ncbi:MAG: MlrC domain protein [Armatimonadetes bacterium CG07_land_8_20_14_0_80_59_28]|nr:MAG: MlrC domain protein [Armatimonadetes bacterium CG07_land_8_20_14_0_80_59_28]PIX40945.1 MAG: MlrC domain protein [Armatimonadetes bacterium CG_4_8_14_3_um_filter_58_9]